MFDIFLLETTDGVKFYPDLGDKRMVYVDELSKDDGTMEKLN